MGKEKEATGNAWWTPADLSQEPLWEKVPQDGAQPSTLPNRPWKAGEARPMGTLPLSSSEAAGVCAFACLGLWSLGAHQGAIPLATSGLGVLALVVGANMMLPLAAGFQTWSDRQWGVAGIALGAKVAVTQASGVLLSVGARVAGLARLPVGAVAPKAGERLLAFEKMLTEADFGMRLRSRRLREDGIEGLTEIGAWRLARHHMMESNTVAAVKVWMARPFNPSWKVRLHFKADGTRSEFFGEKMSFLDAIERSSKSAVDEYAGFLTDAALSMRAASERLQLSETLGSDAVGAQGNEATGKKGPAPRAARL